MEENEFWTRIKAIVTAFDAGFYDKKTEHMITVTFQSILSMSLRFDN